MTAVRTLQAFPWRRWQGIWALLGTTMAPDYEEIDYEDGTDALLEQYPEYCEELSALLKRPEME